jgi:hypothetical protein
MERESTKKKKQAMLTALENSLGIVSTACRKANVSRSQHYEWLKADEDYKTEVDAITETSIDLAEASLLSQIQNRNTSATIFYLKTKGKNRGYIETTELVGDGIQPITVKVIEGNKD